MIVVSSALVVAGAVMIVVSSALVVAGAVMIVVSSALVVTGAVMIVVSSALVVAGTMMVVSSSVSTDTPVGSKSGVIGLSIPLKNQSVTFRMTVRVFLGQNLPYIS